MFTIDRLSILKKTTFKFLAKNENQEKKSSNTAKKLESSSYFSKNIGKFR